MPVPNGMRFRNACFTINNPPMDENQGPGAYQEPAWCPDKMRYLGYALERASSGTIHWQGYVELKSPTTLSSLKVLLGNNPHIEARQGTAQQARDYYAEPGDKPGETLQPAKEFGKLSAQGKRNDLEQVVAAVKVFTEQALFAEAIENWMDAYQAYLASRSAHEAYLDSLAYHVGRGQSAGFGGTLPTPSDQIRQWDQQMAGRSQASPSPLHSQASGVSLGPTRDRQVHQGDHRSPNSLSKGL